MNNFKSGFEKIVYEHLILLTMMEFGDLSLEKSMELLNDSKILDPRFESRLFHDEPYYWGVTLWFGFGNNEWHKNEEYWPIPKRYRDLENNYHDGNTRFKPPLND